MSDRGCLTGRTPRLLVRIVAVHLLVLGLPAAASPEELLAMLLDQEQAVMRAAAGQPGDPALTRRMAELRAQVAYQKFAADDVDGAAAYLENSLTLDPDHADRWAMLGDLYQLIGVPGAGLLAQDAYQRALALDPARSQTRIKLAAAFMASQRFGRAIEEFETALTAQTPPDGEYVVPLTAAYAVTGQAKRGIGFCGKMLKAGGDDRFRVAQAILTRQAGDRRAAIKLLKQVEAGAPGTELAVYAVHLRHGYEDEEPLK